MSYTTGFHPAPIKHYSISLAYFSSPYIRPYGNANPSQTHKGVGVGVGFLFDVEEHCVGHKIIMPAWCFLAFSDVEDGVGERPSPAPGGGGIQCKKEDVEQD